MRYLLENLKAYVKFLVAFYLAILMGIAPLMFVLKLAEMVF